MADYLSTGTGLLGNLPDWMLFGQGEEQNRPNAMLGGTPVQGVPNPMFGDRWQPAYDAAQSGQWFASDPSYPTPEQLAPRPGFPNSAPLPPPPAYPGANQYAGQSPTMAYAPEQPKPQQPLANFPAQAPQQSGWDRFGQGINNNAMTLVGLGAGIAGGRGWGEGISQGLRGAMAGQVADRNQRTITASQQATAQALLAKGVPPAVVNAAIQNPKMLEVILKQAFPEFSAEKNNENNFSFNKATGEWTYKGSVPRFDTLGPDQVLQQTTPSVGRGGGTSGPVASGGPAKAPAGYQWRDPKDQSKGMDPIPGGPATHLPAETAGRLALMQAAKPDLENAKQYFLSDKFKSGPVDAAVTAGAQALEAGDTGRARTAVRRSIEAALRTATGAAAPESEVKRYERYYLPSVYDAVETRRQKLEALDRFNEHAERNVGQGRMPPPESFLKTKAKPDPLGFR